MSATAGAGNPAKVAAALALLVWDTAASGGGIACVKSSMQEKEICNEQ